MSRGRRDHRQIRTHVLAFMACASPALVQDPFNSGVDGFMLGVPLKGDNIFGPLETVLSNAVDFLRPRDTRRRLETHGNRSDYAHLAMALLAAREGASVPDPESNYDPPGL